MGHEDFDGRWTCRQQAPSAALHRCLAAHSRPLGSNRPPGDDPKRRCGFGLRFSFRRSQSPAA
jgi:hypothetical protein